MYKVWRHMIKKISVEGFSFVNFLARSASSYLLFEYFSLPPSLSSCYIMKICKLLCVIHSHIYSPAGSWLLFVLLSYHVIVCAPLFYSILLTSCSFLYSFLAFFSSSNYIAISFFETIDRIFCWTVWNCRFRPKLSSLRFPWRAFSMHWDSRSFRPERHQRENVKQDAAEEVCAETMPNPEERDTRKP